MITPMALHTGVCDFLAKEVAPRHRLKSLDSQGGETLSIPQVVRSGWVLQGGVDEDWEREAFPYILPRISKIEHQNGREGVLTLDILFGVYGPGFYDGSGRLIDDGSGYRDLWNLIESVRQALMVRRIIEGRYRIREDFFQAEMIPEQIEPYWEGYCRTKWDMAFPFPQ